ncbi:MAG: serine--tRNA ligase [Chloroflexota bacterium]|nr:serine--tRNA ligase [Chloroflexota bacterium]MDE3194054.1 serine--tRNA ligase [Chloroflexota bacterium]
MRPIDRIRTDPEEVRRTLRLRGFDAPLDRIIELDAKVRQLKSESEGLKAERNRASKGGPPSPEVRERMRAIGERIKEIDAELAVAQKRIDEDLLWIPNVIDPSVPEGADDKENVLVFQDPATELGFTARPHWEIGEALGILDIPRGTKLSGSRFYVLRGAGAALQRALIAWMIDLKITRGFVEIYPPFLTKRETLEATGQLPHFDANLYRDTQDDLWLVPTAEPQLVAMHKDETFEAADLPRRYVAYTACFRREHMSAGRDVRGIKRGHQFDKVEMVIHCLPQDSPAELELMRELAVEVLRKLRIPARVVERCTGDLGFNALKGYDLEAWAPGQGEWLEVSSISNCGAFQAERSSIRLRRDAAAKPELVHTLNASGLALPRLMIAVLENYQQADGSVLIPDAVRPYMGGRERIAPGEFSL